MRKFFSIRQKPAAHPDPAPERRLAAGLGPAGSWDLCDPGRLKIGVPIFWGSSKMPPDRGRKFLDCWRGFMETNLL
jgi:hypothetical protein